MRRRVVRLQRLTLNTVHRGAVFNKSVSRTMVFKRRKFWSEHAFSLISFCLWALKLANRRATSNWCSFYRLTHAPSPGVIHSTLFASRELKETASFIAFHGVHFHTSRFILVPFECFLFNQYAKESGSTKIKKKIGKIVTAAVTSTRAFLFRKTAINSFT